MMLDTNAVSALADGDEFLTAQLTGAAELHIPVIVLGEYRYGIRQSRCHRTYTNWLVGLIEDVQVIPVLESTACEYARVSRELKDAGTPIPTNDVWIAALCREHRLPLVSRDAHFDTVQRLRRIGW